MASFTTGFFVAGGTLPGDAVSYIERAADQELFTALLGGEYCHVLTSRQMGKSSLMVRTAARLRETEVFAVVLDLTAIGQNVSPEQWYSGLLDLLGAQLDLEEETRAYWRSRTDQGPLRRWVGALTEVIAPAVRAAKDARAGQADLVIFVDEVDAVRSLPFSTDEFFAAIRELYNRRASAGEPDGIAFCLLGVVSPADLIRDTRSTPFNVGRRIRLTDFTPAEAAPFKVGLQLGSPDSPGRSPLAAQRLLERVLYWTGGHPYLTQRLCHAVAEETGAITAADVDRVCHRLFLNPRASEQDDNLVFVREQLLRSEVDTTELLELYRRILRQSTGRFRRLTMPDDDANAMVSCLRLSGVVAASAGRLRSRNRLYATAFDAAWIDRHLPDAERRLQRAAYLRGVLRTASVSLSVLTAFGGLAVAAFRSEQRAQTTSETYSELLYLSNVALAQQQLRAGLLESARQLLDQVADTSDRRDLRDFEWGYLRRASQARFPTLRIKNQAPEQLAFSTDGRRLIVSCWTGRALIWDLETGLEVTSNASDKGTNSPVIQSELSSHGKFMARSYDNQRGVELVDLTDTDRSNTVVPCEGTFSCAFSGDEKRFVINVRVTSMRSKVQRLRLINLDDPNSYSDVDMFVSQTTPLALSHHGDLVAILDQNRLRLMDWKTRQITRTMILPNGIPTDAQFSTDGKYIAVVGTPDPPKPHSRSFGKQPETWITIWKLHSQNAERMESRLDDHYTQVQFGPDNRRVFVTDDRGRNIGERLSRLTILDRDSLKILRTIPDITRSEGAPHRTSTPLLVGYALSPDGQVLATRCTGAHERDRVLQLWRTHDGSLAQILGRGIVGSEAMGFSPDGRILATSSRDLIQLFEVPRLAHWRDVGDTSWVSFTSEKSIATVQIARNKAGTRNMASSVLLCDRISGRIVRKLPVERPFCMDASRDKPLIAVGSGGWNRQGAVRVFNIKTGQQVSRTELDSTIWSVKFAPGGRHIVASCRDGSENPSADGHWKSPRSKAVVIEVSSGRMYTIIQNEATGVVAVSLNGRYWATASASAGARAGTVSVWETGSGRRMWILEAGRYQTESLAFSPGGEWLASGGGDEVVRVWETSTGRLVSSLRGHTGNVGSVVFSPSGRRIASKSVDGSVRIWDVKTGRQVLLFDDSNTSKFDSDGQLAFSPDGLQLICSGREGPVVWEAEPASGAGQR